MSVDIRRKSQRLQHHHAIVPLLQLPTLRRLDTLPFIIVYSALILIDHGILFSSIKSIDLQKWSNLLLFPLTFIFHISLVLAAQWSVKIQSMVGYKKLGLKQSHQWTHCLVVPPSPDSNKNQISKLNEHQTDANGHRHVKSFQKVKKRKDINVKVNVGRTEIVPVQIHFEKSKGKRNSMKVAILSYEETVFRCCIDDENKCYPGRDTPMDSIWMNADASTATKKSLAPTTRVSSAFHQLHYPTDLPLSFYKSWKGHASRQSIANTKAVYSTNALVVNLPPFLSLLSQQLLAPFFLFQLLCVLLWCLDEYWYYALFTLFTLVLFECTVAQSRLKNLSRLRETLRPPMNVWVYRKSLWERRRSDQLIAGDIISMNSRVDGMANNHEGGTHVPCDLLLMKGNAVLNEAMLTGESVPQLKESIDLVVSAFDDGDDVPLDMDDATFKRAILFGGTVLVNHSIKDAEKSSNNESGWAAMEIPDSPDDGCLALVLRTGFDTQQGSLLRTMVHTSTKSQSDGVNTKDTFLFIMILLCCAVFSSAFVLHHAWDDPNRNRFKLLLHVIIIITSVVPPELPMELSLAVTASLADLVRRCAVYCTEPFRIPLAGMVDTCCFDKTGTLTSDDMVMRGVRLPIRHGNEVEVTLGEELDSPMVEVSEDGNVSESAFPIDVMRVMVGCQSLSSTPDSKGLIGDPLEKAVLEGCGWNLFSNDNVVPPHYASNLPSIKILHRFAFTSKLKRMTVISQDYGSDDLLALSKGAPETLKAFFEPSSIPSTYNEVSKYHMSKGQRVLAMGYRKLGSKDSLNTWKKRGRNAVEAKLIFAGFLVLDCPLKPDSKKIIKELKQSGHQTVMITGDAVLTAVEVARQVGMYKTKGDSEVYELRSISSSQEDDKSDRRFAFVPISISNETEVGTDKCIAYSHSNISIVKSMLESSKIAAICVTGDTLTKIAVDAVRTQMEESSSSSLFIDPKTVLLHPDAQSFLHELAPLITVYARHAPRQKEAVVAAFNGAGHVTLYCGDGTNDVSALKMSHVGISIISVPDLEKKQRDAIDGLTEAQGKKKKKKKKSKKPTKSWEEHMRALAEAEEELNTVALGDASVASPFTSRVTSIRCTKDVLQRGRCTLVTMIQIYKILGVNCLVNAMVLSTLHLAGAKQGDSQMTVVGFVVAGLFFLVTKGEPLSKISPHRPPSSVLCTQVLVSISIQFGIHFACIMATATISKFYLDPFDPSLVPDGAFNPNTLNSATFIMSVLTVCNTFVCNYRGRPFMQDLKENKYMMKGLQICYIGLFACALEVFPPLNDLMQLAPLPLDGEKLVGSIPLDDSSLSAFLMNGVDQIGFKLTLCLLMVIDTASCYYCEKQLVRLFEPKVK